ncbi:MAG: plastocyanin/azurin family copper-binding protein [Thaumarchaeota archaeon]|nr:plastocyanin/azurin family copper-binding protein [Nitrososphaerota archaeon]
MSNWDLMMPGMGLTAIGLAGIVISYAGIAHTFIDGMHALTGLTMFIGLIFLAVGILDGGVSTSNKAKATTLVILSIGLGFGMFAFTFNTSDFTVTLAGILMAIAFPAIMIAYIASKMPQYLKPVGSITAMAGATGIIMWVAFGFVSPDTYMIQEQSVEIEVPDVVVEPAGPIFTISVLEGSSVQDTPDYDPDVANVPKGHIVEWINNDTLAHTVTSFDDVGETFDSSLFGAGESFTLDTSTLDIGEYEYFCIVHPWMVSTLIIEEVEDIPTVVIPDGAGIIQDGQIYYDPDVITVSVGSTVVWDNIDSVFHTITSGTPDGGLDGLFDSSIVSAGETFSYTFDEAGSIDYYCIVHPWMIGTVIVE